MSASSQTFTPLHEAPSPSLYGLTSDNRLAVEATIDYAGLPAPTVIPRADAVFVAVADVDDLGVWLAELGGRIHVASAGDGLELWTLLTQTPARGDGRRVQVRVSVPVPMGEPVMHEIRAAVA